MYYLFFFLAILLVFGLAFSVVKYGYFRIWAKAFRIVVVVFAVGIFTLFFVRESVDQFKKNSLAVQIINKLQLPLDFYLIKINNDAEPEAKYETRHIGTIRSNHYRIEYEDMKNSDEFWLAGRLGKNDFVYFSQHAVPNRNEDQIVEIRNYINQSIKLSTIAKTQIALMNVENMKTAVWITLDFLLLFLNVVLLLRKENKKSRSEAGLAMV